MKHCSECNLDYLEKSHRKHLSSNRHLRNAFSFEYIYKIEKIPVKITNQVFYELIGDYFNNFDFFVVVTKIGSKKLITPPQRYLLNHHNPDDEIDISIYFFFEVERQIYEKLSSIT